LLTFVIALFDMIIFDLFDSADISRTVLNLITALFDFRTLLCFWKVLLLIYMYNDYKSTFSDSLNPKKLQYMHAECDTVIANLSV